MNELNRRHTLEEFLGTRFERLSVIVKGDSMEPVLHSGDKVRIASKRGRPGDIIAFFRGEEIVLHRMLFWWFKQGTWHIIAKGDNLEGIDAPVDRKKVLGTVLGWNREDAWIQESKLDKLIRMIKSMGGYLVTRYRRQTH